MLVLSRKKNEVVVVDNGRIVITVVSIRGNKVRLGIEAGPDVPVRRKEVQDAINRQQTDASAQD